MTRRPTGATGDTSQVYAWLLDRELQAAQLLGGSTPWSPEQPSYSHRPERLEALQTGRPIDLPAADLPPFARVGVDCSRWTHRAQVDRDGTIEFLDDAGEFAIENGL